MKTGIERITEERQRQIDVEGLTKEHDSKHDSGELADAAVCYADLAAAQVRGAGVEESVYSPRNCWGDLDWPWDDEWFKPSENPIRNLEKAGALIAAEIDRLQNRALR